MNVTIYALCCPTTGEARYVGKTIHLYTRVRGHLYEKTPSYKKNWIASLKKMGLKPVVRVLEIIENSNDEDWQDRERWWIKSLKEDGCRLTNLENGGMGGKIIPDEVKYKISRANKGRKPSALAIERSVLARKGKHHSEATREKMRVARVGRSPSPSCFAASRLACTGKPKSLETRAKMSASKQNQPPRPQDVRDRISRSMIGREPTDAHRKAMSLAAYRRYAKPSVN